jgi:hypothetical protein
MTYFDKLLFDEFRVVPVNPTDTKIETQNIVKAITDNENLTSLGYTLKAPDIVTLSKCKNTCIFDIVNQYIDRVKADPMYPDFPNQVMNISEAEFRFHQLVHYFSTYGMESLFDIETQKGWLPDVTKTEKTEKQEIVLPAKTISLIKESEKYIFTLKKLLTKRERLTIPEKELITIAARQVSYEDIRNTPVAFKENLMDLFHYLFDNNEDETIKAICQHTGDVLTCLRFLLTKHHYKLTTSERKRCVRILESYPVADFKNNLILSHKKAKNSLLILNYISYNKFSKSASHQTAVNDLRNNCLKSWESQMKNLIKKNDPTVIQKLADRPGYLLRNTAWLLRSGYSKDEINNALCDNASALSAQTILTILNKFLYFKKNSLKTEASDVCFIMYNVLTEKLKTLNTPLKNQKIFIEEGIYDFDTSIIETNDKSEEGGYIRSGLTFKIPDNINILRFFVYWNDKRRTDIDLHATGLLKHDNTMHIGWNGDFRKSGAIHSGDITHSDAAEYIDVNLNSEIKKINAIIHFYNNTEAISRRKYIRKTFADIETCFTGIMGVSKAKENIELYEPANCFISHNLKSKNIMLNYTLIDVENRKMQLIAKPIENKSYNYDFAPGLSVTDYISMLAASQNATIVDNKEDADLTIRLDKGGDISLIDENYFMDY